MALGALRVIRATVSRAGLLLLETPFLETMVPVVLPQLRPFFPAQVRRRRCSRERNDLPMETMADATKGG